MKNFNIQWFLLGFIVTTLFWTLALRADEDCSTTSSSASIEEQLEISTDVPNFLKDAKIVVILPDGRSSEVPAKLFKVVPRKQQFIVTKTKETEKMVCKPEEKKNRISILGGAGPKGNLSVSSDGSKVIVQTDSGAIGGMSYQRKVSDRMSIGAQVQTNESALISVGVDF